jgi:7-carboxy-7-deazaguanine synthase
MINVVESFYSVQGEGPFCGSPSFFIRFANCRLKCPWCDTKYSWGSKSGSALSEVSKYILSKIKNETPENCHIVLTGGEPLLNYKQKEFKDLYYLLERTGKNITFETTLITMEEDLEDTTVCKKLTEIIDHYGLYASALFVISPKLDSECYPFSVTNSTILDYYSNIHEFPGKVHYKLVYKREYLQLLDNLLYTLPLSFIQNNVSIMPFTPIPFSLEDYRKSCIDTVEFCKDYGLRYSPRLHIDIWEMKKGV